MTVDDRPTDEGLRPPRPLLPVRTESQLSRRQRQVLDELEELFLSSGFSSFTVRDLAAHVQCSLRTLYAIAPSKQALALVVLDRFLHRVGRTAMAAIDPAAPVADRIRAYFRSGAELQRWTAALAEDSAGEPEVTRLLDRHFAYVSAVLERLIAEGVARGELRTVRPGVAAAVLSGAALHLARSEAGMGVADLAPAIIDELIDIVLVGIAC